MYSSHFDKFIDNQMTSRECPIAFFASFARCILRTFTYKAAFIILYYVAP